MTKTMSGSFTRLKRMVLVLGFSSALTLPAAAELPPQYTVWHDFAAITAKSEIPAQLGVVDRIERTDEGYRVSGGNCSINVTIVRKGPVGPHGPMVGPSKITAVNLGEKTCR